MKQTLLLLLLVLGMCSINVSSQTGKPVRKTTTTQTRQRVIRTPKVSREFHQEKDGFEWYKVGKNGKWGAEDKNGNLLVPVENNDIRYQYSNETGPGFPVRKNGDAAYYSPQGECVIPFTRHYHIIHKERNTSVGTYYWGWTKKDGPLFLCNESGEEICRIEGYSIAEPYYQNGKFFFKVGLHGWHIMDGNGNLIYGPENIMYFDGDIVMGGKNGGDVKKLGSLSAISTTNNLFAKTVKKGISYTSTYSSGSSSSSTTSSSISNSSNNNHRNNTTTIHVEHHRDPVPVQEWQQCNICYGSGNCSICGGNGWNPYSYANGRYVRCISCGGNGRCSYCAGRGGKNITVYR